MQEFSESDIKRWSRLSEENRQIFASYIQAKQKADEAYDARDGAATSGWALRRTMIREEIGRRIFG